LLGILAAEAAFADGDEWLDAVLAQLDANRALLGERLAADIPAIQWQPPEAGYLAWLDCRALGLGDDPAEFFLERGRLALSPGLDYGREGTGFARLNFGTSPELVADAVRRMGNALAERDGEARARLDAARSKLPSRHREMTAEESNKHEQPPIRLASVADAPAFGRLLYAFNVEFGESTPDATVIAERAAPLLESGDVTVLFAGEGPEGFAELRFRPSLYTGALDAYLEELYVVPERRGQGLGRALLEAAMDYARERGAARIDLNTSVDDVVARALYESAGFTNREGGPEGPPMLYYERDL
jgi:GNAT superfamily N-acetyltransferase